MNKNCQQENREGRKDFWGEAIADVQRKIVRVEKRLKGLKAAEQTFRLHRKQGRAWPGEVAGTDKESVPA